MADQREDAGLGEVESVPVGGSFTAESGQEILIGGNPDVSQKPGVRGVKLEGVPGQISNSLLTLRVGERNVLAKPSGSNYEIYHIKHKEDGKTEKRLLRAGDYSPLGPNIDLSVVTDNGNLLIRDLAEYNDEGRIKVVIIDWDPKRAV